MKLIIIGAVAAGTSAAARARRNNEAAQITVYERDSEISYSGCGLPYWIGGEVEDRESLVPRNAAFFKSKYNVDIHTRHAVLAIDPKRKSVRVKRLETGDEFDDAYDALIIATGAASAVPAIPGADGPGVFVLRNPASADAIRGFVIEHAPARAIIIGTGFIGLELAENLAARGVHVTMLESAPRAMPSLDPDMSRYLEAHLRKQGVELLLNAAITVISGTPGAMNVSLADGGAVEAGMVIIAAGVKPEVSLAASAGVALGASGAIAVNERMETSVPGIWACGDCAEAFSVITGAPLYRPLGSTANKMGRIAGDRATGGAMTFRGILGTGIFRVFGATVARTGLTECEARAGGMDVAVCHNIKPDKPEYLHGEEMVIKAIADRATGRLLGAQIFGKAGVDKRIDVIATAITFGAKAEDLEHLDLAYAPPFATTKDPVIYTGMILANALKRNRPLITPEELCARASRGEKIQIVDARVAKQYAAAHVDGAMNMPHESLRDGLAVLDPELPTVTHCNKGVTGNAAQNILLNRGFRSVYNLSGGHRNYSTQKEKP